MEANTSTSTPGTGLLGLRSVLAGSLPAALMTDDAPDRYTVEAIFTRRPEQDETTEILGPATREFLTRAGYPDVAVTISDRRLRIENTNLEELRGGLANAVADRLAEISIGVHDKQNAAAQRFEDAAERERVRAVAVAALADTVSFATTAQAQAQASALARMERAATDSAQIDGWTDEGGHGR